MADLVVIPVYNEAPSVERVLGEVRAAAPRADILVIDDGSTDGSSEILRRIPGIRVIRHRENLGYGAALLDGFAFAQENGYARVVTMDCDEQHEPRLIPEFLEHAREWDVVSGSRYLDPSVPKRGNAPEDRRRINALITERINQLTGYRLTDAFCGFKAYRVPALKRLELSERGYAFPLQFWIQAARAGLTVVERPVPLIYVPNFERRFGGDLDDADRRLKYYLEVIEKEVAKCSTS
ncbi:MAG: glycosyltransferase family 2 protein [Firmicutes bacterium]|nr:glycosyltransferase family 2 protein [Bacillota bacterium]